jgi:putative transposase
LDPLSGNGGAPHRHRKVELAFDPFDLADIEVRYGGRSFGRAVAFTIGRHAHPKARPEQPAAAPPATGIDYLALVGTAHDAVLPERINYAALLGTSMILASCPAR